MAELVRLEGGPHLGLIAVEPPLHASIELGVNENLQRDDGPQPYAYAIYTRESQDAEPVYMFRAYRRAQSAAPATKFVPEDRLEDAIKSFYENPNYDIYTTKPTDRHQQVLVQVGHRRAHVDTGIASVIRELFRLGLDTIGSCQEGAAGEPFEGQAYVGFCRERDARRFYNILTAGGIEATFKPKTLKITTRQSSDAPPDLIDVPSGNVLFPSSQIERITELLQSEIPNA